MVNQTPTEKELRKFNAVLIIIILVELAAVVILIRLNDIGKNNYCADLGGTLYEGEGCIIKDRLDLCRTPAGGVARGQSPYNISYNVMEALKNESK